MTPLNALNAIQPVVPAGRPGRLPAGPCAFHPRDLPGPPPGRAPPVLHLQAVGLGAASVSFSAGASDIVHLAGGSRVTRLRVLALAAGFAQGASGRCEILGHDWHQLDDAGRRALRARHIARVLAGDGEAAAPSVLSAVAVPLLRQGVDAAEAQRRAEVELSALGAGALAPCVPATLNAAASRLVLLARATAQRPRLLVLEDPETALDAPAVAALRLTLWTLATTFDTCIVMTSTQPRLTAIADRRVDLDHHSLSLPLAGS